MITMPAQRPHRSKQDYATPREFIVEVEREFGPIGWDLAAERNTCVIPFQPQYFGPDHPIPAFRDSLSIDWAKRVEAVRPSRDALCWLNPPFGSIAPWARKCALESSLGARIALLVPASVGANWFWDFVAPHARVFALSPRLSFDGKHPFPKDLVLALYGDRTLSNGFERWQWKHSHRSKAA